MEIAKKQNGGELTLVISGRLDTNTSKHLEAELKNSLDNVATLVFDIKNLEYISSAGLRVLLSAQKVIKRQGDMVIRGANKEVERRSVERVEADRKR